jgi:hypothetical protein
MANAVAAPKTGDVVLVRGTVFSDPLGVLNVSLGAAIISMFDADIADIEQANFAAGDRVTVTPFGTGVRWHGTILALLSETRSAWVQEDGKTPRTVHIDELSRCADERRFHSETAPMAVAAE